MKNAKKFLAIMLAAVMALAIAVPAFAEEEGNTITITGALSDHTFSAYKIFGGTINEDGELTGIVWGDGFNTGKVADLVSDLNTAFELELASNSTAAAVATAIADFDDEAAKTLADIFAKYTTDTKTDSEEGEGDTVVYTISGLDDGYYLVKDASAFEGENDFISDFILKLVGDADVSVKGDVPTVDKKVLDGDSYADGTTDAPVNVQVGDVLDFKIDATLPSNYADYTTYKLVFSDTADATLRLINTTGTYGLYVDDTEVEGASSLFAFSGNTLTVTIADVKALGVATSATSVITVKYQAEVLKTAVSGTANANTVTLEYSNDPHSSASTGTTPGDTVNVVTESFKLVKFDGADNKLLAGAKFTLKAGNEDVVLVKDGDNIYRVADSTDTAPATPVVIETNTTGAITINGLDADVTYTLIETEAPDGYNALENGVTVTVSAATTAATATITNGVYAESEYVVGVENNSGSVLPATGGMGTMLFITIGAVLLVVAGVVLTAKKRLYNEG